MAAFFFAQERLEPFLNLKERCLGEGKVVEEDGANMTKRNHTALTKNETEQVIEQGILLIQSKPEAEKIGRAYITRFQSLKYASKDDHKEKDNSGTTDQKANANQQKQKEALQILIAMNSLNKSPTKAENEAAIIEIAKKNDVAIKAVETVKDFLAQHVGVRTTAAKGIGLFRRNLLELDTSLQVKVAIALAKELSSKKITETNRETAKKYKDLSTCKEESLGRALHDFYVERGFRFPGELDDGDESAINHDALHILLGANTDDAGELIMACAEAAMSKNKDMESADLDCVVEFYCQFLTINQEDNNQRACQYVNYCAQSGYRMGREINSDLVANLDFWASKDEQISALRSRFNIKGIKKTKIAAPGNEKNVKSFYAEWFANRKSI